MHNFPLCIGYTAYYSIPSVIKIREIAQKSLDFGFKMVYNRKKRECAKRTKKAGVFYEQYHTKEARRDRA